MGIFSKKKEVSTDVKAVAQQAAPVVASASVILAPRMTEKAMNVAEKNVYVFEVQKGASKGEIAQAITFQYGVTPVKVHTTTQQPRRVKSRRHNKMVTIKGLKKAYVYLREGDSITA